MNCHWKKKASRIDQARTPDSPVALYGLRERRAWVPGFQWLTDIFRCSNVETPIWNVMREMPPRLHSHRGIFPVTGFGVTDQQHARRPAHGVEPPA